MEHTPSPVEILRFLADHHGEAVDDLEPLAGGVWSSAYGYRVGARQLVLRVGEVREGFAADRAAMAFAGADLPVPEVLDIGDAFGQSYAISVRHHGTFLELVDPADALRAGPALVGLLDALRRRSPSQPGATAPGTDRPAADAHVWHDFLRAGLTDDPAARVHGWRTRLAGRPDVERVFVEAERRVESLLDACPERRDLVHSDLLHQNVLLGPDAATVTAVFSWKCSTWGDFLYDTAWCTFWSPWHPGIAAIDVWTRMTEHVGAVGDADDLVEAALRHHAYEVQIGASHLGWYAWIGDDAEMARASARIDEILERGPVAVGRESP